MEFSAAEIEEAIHVPQGITVVKAKLYQNVKSGKKTFNDKIRFIFSLEKIQHNKKIR